MKYTYILALVSCLIMTSAFAETLQNVEYHLPKVAQDWEIGNKLESEKGITLIYIPKGTRKQTFKEFFGVNINTHSSDPNDTFSLKNALKKLYPHLDINFREIEKTPSSVLYEWSAKENGQEKIYGLGRGFSTQDGSVLLSYQTENISDAARARSIWLLALKDAKIK